MIKSNSIKKVAGAIGKGTLLAVPTVIPLVNPTAVESQQNIPAAEQNFLARFEFYQGNKVGVAEVYKTSRTDSGYEVRYNGKRFDNLFSIDFDGDKKFGDFEKEVIDKAKLTYNKNIDKIKDIDARRALYAMYNNSGEIEFDARNQSGLENKMKEVLFGGGAGVEVRFDPIRGVLVGPTGEISWNFLYENNSMLGLGLNASVLFPTEPNKTLSDTSTEPSAYGITGRTLTEQESAMLYKIMADFKVGSDKFYLLGKAGASFATGSNDVTISTSKNGEPRRSNSDNEQYANANLELGAGLGLTFKSGFGLEAGWTTNVPTELNPTSSHSVYFSGNFRK